MEEINIWKECIPWARFFHISSLIFIIMLNHSHVFFQTPCMKIFLIVLHAFLPLIYILFGYGNYLSKYLSNQGVCSSREHGPAFGRGHDLFFPEKNFKMPLIS